MKQCKVCIVIFLEHDLESFDAVSILAGGETCALKRVFNYGCFLKEMPVLTEL